MALRKGHIRINHKDYLIYPERYQQSLANPWAAKIGTGSGEYDDLEEYSAWLMDDWRAGVGLLPADGNGFLFGSAETRFKNKLFLSGLWKTRSRGTPSTEWTGPGAYLDLGSLNNTITLGTGGDYDKLAIRHPTGSINDAWLFARIPSGGGITLSSYGGPDDGDPDAVNPPANNSDTATADEEREDFYWLEFSGFFAANSGAYEYIVIEPSDPSILVEIPLIADPDSNDYQTKSGGTWSTVSGSGYMFPFVFDVSETFGMVGFVRTPGWGPDDDMGMVNERQINTTTTHADGFDYWTLEGSQRSSNIVDFELFNGELYLAQGTSGMEKYTGSTFSSVTLSGSGDSSVLTKWNFYMYSAYANKVQYTSDGSTWSSEHTICSSDLTITAMAGLGAENDIYCATTGGLFRFAEGDFSFGVFPFGSVDDANGKGMTNYQGDLYIPADGTLYRYGQNGTILDVWISQEEDLPAERIGNIKALAAVNQYLVAFVDPTETGGKPSAWAWNGEGWHHLATLPQGLLAKALYYDRTNSHLWFGCSTSIDDTAMSFYMYIPEGAANPLRDSAYEYQPFAWLETDWFYGGLRELDKDWESVYISGDNLSSDILANVYWKDDASTQWESLGSFTSNRQEIRWSDTTTRPNSKQIKIGVLMQTDDQTVTPVVRAIRIKYHAMVNDRKRWQLVVKAADEQRMLDGSNNVYDAGQIRAQIDAAATQVTPVIFEALNGTEYNVKVQQHYETPEKFEVLFDGTIRYDTNHALTLMEV